MTDRIEILISIIVLAAVAFAVWRGGQANPVGTGTIARRLSSIDKAMVGIASDARQGRDANEKAANLEKSMRSIGEKLAAVPTSERIDKFEHDVEHRLSTVESQLSNMATKADVARLDGAIAVVQKSLEHVCKQADGIEAGVIRLEQFLMNGGGK